MGETNWSLLNTTGDVPEDMLRHGVENGNTWVPGEVNTSIRPEWFYHPKEDTKVKTVPKLMDIYYNSVGRNGTLLLNFPIMPNGLIHPIDEQNALEFAKARNEAFGINLVKNAVANTNQTRGKSPRFAAKNLIDNDVDTYWATDDNNTAASLTLDFGKATSFNRFLVQEPISFGQRVKSFTLEAFVKGNWVQIAKETTIGYKRILRFSTVTATKLRFNILDAKSCLLISNIEVYKAPIILSPPTIMRDKDGLVSFFSGDAESEIYYTLDGSNPNTKSAKYIAAVKTTEGQVEIKAISYNPFTKQNSIASEEKFDVSRKNWKIISTEDIAANKLLDGNSNTSWHQKRNQSIPTELVIDMGKTEQIEGFRYLPAQNWWEEASIITHYQFEVSSDNTNWKVVSEGEFSNIKNSPFWQIKIFTPISARYLKFRALKNTQESSGSGYAELDIITTK